MNGPAPNDDAREPASSTGASGPGGTASERDYSHARDDDKSHVVDGRGVPQNLDAERSVIGSMLLDPNAVPLVAAIVGPDDFYRPRYALIFRALAAVHAAHGVTDPVSVLAELERRGRLADVGGQTGGLAQLLDLAECVVTAAGVERHAEIVREKSRQRRIRETCLDVARRAFDNELDTDDLLDVARRQLDGIASGVREPIPEGRVWTDVANDPPIEWLVDGLVPVGGTVFTGGEPGAGKTLLVTDLALRAAHGLDFMGRAVRPHSTLLLASEGSLGPRLRAWIAAHPGAVPAEGHYVHVIARVPALATPNGARDLRAMIAEARRVHGRNPDVVVVDTFARAMAGADENAAGEVGAVVGAVATIQREIGCAVNFLHHTRKPSAERGAKRSQHDLRGSSALNGAADCVMIAGTDGDAHAIRVEKTRDGEEGRPMRYVIRSQSTGRTRDDGTPEHAPIVLPAPEAAAEAEPDLDARASHHERIVVDKLRELGSASSANAVVSRCKGNRAQLLAAWGECLRTRGTIKDIGTTRVPKYVASDPAGGSGSVDSARAAPPRPPSSGNQEPPAAGWSRTRKPRAVPGTSGNHLGTMEPSLDDGCPEQPGAPRRKVAR